MGRKSWIAKDPAAMGISNLDILGFSDERGDEPGNEAAKLHEQRGRRSSARRHQKASSANLEYLRQIEAEVDEEEAAAAATKAAKPSERRRSLEIQKKRRSSSKSSASMHEHLLGMEHFVRTLAENKETKKMVRRSLSSRGP